MRKIIEINSGEIWKSTPFYTYPHGCSLNASTNYIPINIYTPDKKEIGTKYRDVSKIWIQKPN